MTAGKALIVIAAATLCRAAGIQFRQPRALLFYGTDCGHFLGPHYVLLFLYVAPSLA